MMMMLGFSGCLALTKAYEQGCRSPNQPPTMNWETQYGKLQFDQFALVRPYEPPPIFA
jgi:hypothetical protein